MNMIERINTTEELTSFKSHLSKVLSSELSLNLKTGKLNEVTAKILGVQDWNTVLGMFKEPTKCQCGHFLDNLGYCVDSNCQNHFWKQHEEQTPENRRIKIIATLEATGYDTKVEFDATEYFVSHAKESYFEEMLERFQLEQWGYCEETDDVAWFFYDENVPEMPVTNLLNFVSLLGDESQGYSVVIDTKSMHQWLSKHHPELAHYAEA